MTVCRLCDGACQGADLGPFLVPDLAWFWDQVAAAGDRRGDEHLSTGLLTVRAPAEPAQRAAAAGLLPGTGLRPNQSRRVPLDGLTDTIRARGLALTPGAVAAHATGRPLATRSKVAAAQRERREDLEALFDRRAHALPDRSVLVWNFTDLTRSGWLARLLRTDDAHALLERAFDVLEQLPDAGRAVDRRLLVAGDPHALDGGQPLAGLVLALSGQSGQRGAAAWAGLGVRGDDLTGGLVSLGVWPRGWAVPAGEVATLPPRTLTNVVWAPPSVPGSWVFVTENPSVLSAAASSSVAGRAHVLCTYGTVSALEAGAVGRLVAAGWQIAVRADFDAAGLGIVRALRQAAPTAVTWRMDADAYELGASRGGGLPLPAEVTDCWDQDLLEVMHARGLAVFEESLLPELLADLDVGVPRSDTADVR